MTAGPIHDLKATIGILLSEATTQRLMEGIAEHLELRPVILTEEDLLTPGTVTGMELLLVDESSVPRLRHMLLAREWQPLEPGNRLLMEWSCFPKRRPRCSPR
jgi:hypothetical protein